MKYPPDDQWGGDIIITPWAIGSTEMIYYSISYLNWAQVYRLRKENPTAFEEMMKHIEEKEDAYINGLEKNMYQRPNETEAELFARYV